MLVHFTRMIGLSVALLLPVLPSSSAFAIELDEANIAAGQLDGSPWFFDIGLYGTSDITAATVTVPDTGSTVLTLECDSVPPGVECLISDTDSGPFASLAGLLQVYPVGDYLVSINGGERTATLSFAATEPDGSVEIMSPSDGAIDVSPTPVVDYLNNCMNCSVLSFLLDGFFDELDDPLEYEASGQVSIGFIEFSDWTSPTKPDRLPQGDYFLLAVAGIVVFSTESFDQGTGPAFEFEYSTGAGRFTSSVFSVPEPSSSSVALAAFGTVGLLAAIRRERRSNAAVASQI
jgi:hypothetical protein